ncbi:hypothetical protein ACFLW0_02765 [Chloroflexota bacterium]
MKRLQAKPLFRTIFAVSLILSLLTVSTSCQVTSNEERLIEGILENVDMVNGEMTIVTEDGETITIKITTSNSEEGENSEYDELEAGTPVKVTVEDSNHADMEDVEVQHKDGENGDNDEAEDTYDDDDSGNKPSVVVADLSSILPSMASIEDVFRMLGLWEDAVAWHEEGLTWAHIADELGYTMEKMYAELMEIAEEHLWAAKEAGLINHEQFEEMFTRFDELAEGWIHEIY